MKVGSLLWLLRYELKLWWREFFSKPGSRITVIMGILFAAVMLLLGGVIWLLSRSAGELSLDDAGFEGGTLLWIAVGFLGFWFLLSFAQAINLCVTTVFERGDLDLLLASPLNSKVILTSRLLSIAIQLALAFSWPFFILVILALVFHPLWGLILTLMCLYLTASSTAMMFSLWLVRVVGGNRARVIAQILASILSALIIVISQLISRFDQALPIPAAWTQIVTRWFSEDGLLGSQSWIWFPARAVWFDPVSVVLTLGLSLGFTWVAVEMMHQAFIQGTQHSAASKPKPARIPTQLQFKENLNQLLLFKEWTLILRNPYLISQIALQFVFLGLFGVIVVRDQQSSALSAAGLVFIGSNLVAALVQICVSGEEASDLLRSSPISNERIRGFKLLAALIPVWLLLSPILGLIYVQGGQWVVATLIFVGGTATNALLSLWNTRPIKFEELFRRGQRADPGDLILGFLNFVSWIAWSGFAYGTQLEADWAGLVFGLIGLIVAVGYWRSRQLGQLLGF